MEQRHRQSDKRSAILACLQGTTAHPSAEMVIQMLRTQRPDISVATVYRNLALLKEQGLIQSIGTVDGTERFDYRTDSHTHFICNCCAAVLDLPEIALPTLLVPEAFGGRVEKCQLTLSGVCPTCLEKAENESVQN